jgi:hypothetical protein
MGKKHGDIAPSGHSRIWQPRANLSSSGVIECDRTRQNNLTQAMRSDISREGYHCRFQHGIEVITERVRVGAN